MSPRWARPEASHQHPRHNGHRACLVPAPGLQHQNTEGQAALNTQGLFVNRVQGSALGLEPFEEAKEAGDDFVHDVVDWPPRRVLVLSVLWAPTLGSCANISDFL